MHSLLHQNCCNLVNNSKIATASIAREHTEALFNGKLLSATTFQKTAEQPNATELYIGYGLSDIQADRCLTAFKPHSIGKNFCRPLALKKQP